MFARPLVVFGLLPFTLLASCASADQTDADFAEQTVAETPQTAEAMSDDTAGDFDAKDFKKTDSGLMYRIAKPGSDKKPTATDTVEVHYRGTFPDGREFDSSYRRGQTISFPLNGVIKGWTEGMQLIGEGGELYLIIPPDLAYGATPPPGIPPNATLHFKVELFNVK